MAALDEPILPSIQVILDKLKSNGTFDQFRKMCLAAIEEEPSYRAQKEHVEILSRRFLNDHETKEMTKNEVRSKLRLYVLEELKKPGVQASHTIEELVENTLESKSSQLFKDILDVMSTLLHPPTPPITENTLQDNDTSSTHELVGGATKKTPPMGGTSRGSFELPIDLLSLPGLSNTSIKSENSKKGLKVNKKKGEDSSNNNELKKTKFLKKKDVKEKEIKKQKTKNEIKTTTIATVKHDTNLPLTNKEEEAIKVEGNTCIKEDEKEEEEESNIKIVDKENKNEGNEKEDKQTNKELVKEDTNETITKEEEEEEEEEVFIDTMTSTVIPSSPDRKSLRRSARIASYSDKSREGTPSNECNKRQLSSEGDVTEENVNKKRKTNDRRQIIRDSSSSEDKQEEKEEIKEKKTHRQRQGSVKSVTSSLSSPPPSKSIKKSSSPVVITRSNRQVKRNRHYYPGEEQTESEDDEKDSTMINEEKEDEKQEEKERNSEKETSSKRRSKRIKK